MPFEVYWSFKNCRGVYFHLQAKDRGRRFAALPITMALSQCLEDSPGWRTPVTRQNSKELYNERHRLALETLISDGVNCFMDFLKKEKMPNFLSDEEMKRIVCAAVVPRCVSLTGDDSHFEQSGTLDCSSVTYFPEISDVEPPVLELGWPAFTTGSFRGVTRAVAYFQPSYGDCIYSCKEAVRRMIKNAKEVIAIVTDSLTDLDIFCDLQEACTRCRIPVYILLDQSCLPSFLQMCKNLNVHLEDLQHMRVRTITGSTYYMRSGARITGKVHERFMLIDGNRVATGSYRFNWTDGKLNSSNLIELSGQITENFDEEFRILYAQSFPLNTRAFSTVANYGNYDCLLQKPPGTPTSQLARAAIVSDQPSSYLTSTPNRCQATEIQMLGKERKNERKKSCSFSDSLAVEENWMEQGVKQDLIADEHSAKTEKVDSIASTQIFETSASLVVKFRHTSTQTVSDNIMQTETDTNSQHFLPISPSVSSSDNANSSNDSSSSNSTLSRDCPVLIKVNHCPSSHRSTLSTSKNMNEYFCKLTKERQYHYSNIRSKLDNMIMLLSHRREPMDLAGLVYGPGLHRGQKSHAEGRPLCGIKDSVFMGTWPRSRGLQ